MTELRVANWNVEWRKPSSRDAGIIRQRLEEFAPDIVCLTEAWTGFLADWGGFEIASPILEDRDEGQRSVVMWSREPWHEVDDLGHADLPRDCFVKGVTATALGKVGIAGIIIPYRFSDVTHGRRNCQVWEQHEQFLDGLPLAIESLSDRSIVLGDFNQRTSGRWVRPDLATKMQQVFAGHELPTSGLIGPNGSEAIDHIALAPGLASLGAGVISNERAGPGSGQVSDHFCVTTIVGRRAT